MNENTPQAATLLAVSNKPIRHSRLRALPISGTTTAVIAFLFFLTLVMTYPLSSHPATSARETGDTFLNAWIMAWGAHSLFRDPLNLFNANIFYP